jgi:hypothetical protein
MNRNKNNAIKIRLLVEKSETNWGFLKKLPASRLDFSQETGAQQAR